MFKNRLLLVVGLLSLLLVAMAVSRPLSDARSLAGLSWRTSAERSQVAEIARWEAMGQYYENQAQLQRSRSADAARWIAQGEYYKNLEAQNIQRSQDVDAARWKAMAEYYQRHSELRNASVQSVDTALEESPIDECFDVSLSEVTACREGSQSSAP